VQLCTNSELLYADEVSVVSEKFSVLVASTAIEPSEPAQVAQIKSRASATAPSRVLQTTAFPCGNMQIAYSGTRLTKIPQPSDMKFHTVNYVNEITKRVKNEWNWLATDGSPDT
jgi:hypothetical protein